MNWKCGAGCYKGGDKMAFKNLMFKCGILYHQKLPFGTHSNPTGIAELPPNSIKFDTNTPLPKKAIGKTII